MIKFPYVVAPKNIYSLQFKNFELMELLAYFRQLQ